MSMPKVVDLPAPWTQSPQPGGAAPQVSPDPNPNPNPNPNSNPDPNPNPNPNPDPDSNPKPGGAAAQVCAFEHRNFMQCMRPPHGHTSKIHWLRLHNPLH